MLAIRGGSRAASVASNSNARDILKRRNKPYRTEQQMIIAKKPKLDIQTTYHTKSPPGYTFLPVGTPELAELCKELSRKRGLPINVVNAEPGYNDKARDPGRVHHHIARIGYHFRCEIVEDACEALNYLPHNNTYVKAAALLQMQHKGVIARAFAKYGVPFDLVEGNEETLEQVRAAIKELFPLIPQHDLNEVVRHAWEPKAKRIGNATDIALPRRAQLAVISRIRHAYTDYDRLLRAFGDWKAVRKEVEPWCLQKLIEWRGETDDDDEGLEEIVRETIVIDDDDDDGPFTGRGDDSSDTGDASDTSIQISHRLAAPEDLRAEEASERDHRFLQRRMPGRTQAQQTDLARQKIQTYRSQAHNARTFAYNQPGRPVQRFYVPTRDGAERPSQVVVGGQLLHLKTQASDQPYAELLNPLPQYEQPMPSIERNDHAYQVPPPPPGGSPPPPPGGPPPPPPPSAYHSQPATPQATRVIQGSNRHVGLTQDYPGYAQPLHEFPHRQYDSRQSFPQAQHSGGFIDTTSSPRRAYNEQRVAQPEVIRVISSGDGRYVQAPIDQPSYARAPEAAPHAWRVEVPHPNGRYHDANAVEYDPNRPLLDVRERVGHNTAPSSRYASPAQSVWRQREQIPSEHAHHAAPPIVQYPYPVPGAYQGQAPAPVAPPRAVTQPVHGAPAPVQQFLRDFAQSNPWNVSREELQRHPDQHGHVLPAMHAPAAADPPRQPASYVAANPPRQPASYVGPQHPQYYPR